ncbi:MAG TPA: hypothetical protein PKK10_18625 [Woeseiaceae bacterium]|nr:hypothetical protein [Woeseiaceae bacterium]
MNLIATLRQRRQAVPLLGIVMVAFLGLVSMPCAIASSFDLPSAEAALAAPSAEHCPNSDSTRPMSPADCCCDLDAASNAAEPDSPKTAPQLVYAVDQYLLAPLVLEQHVVGLNPVSVSATSLPVYLSTQRLRL